MYPALFLLCLLILSTDGATRCLSCQGDCGAVQAVDCPENGRCYSKVTSVDEVRGCIDNTTAICDGPNISSCYTCERDLCNAVGHLGVKQCHVCIDQCEQPMARHDCFAELLAIEGKPVKAACLSYAVAREDEVTVSKGCVPDNAVIRATCSMLNQTPQINCSLCTEELCNGDAGKDGSEEVFPVVGLLSVSLAMLKWL